MNLYTLCGLFAVIVWSAAVGVSGLLVDNFGAMTAVTYELFIGGLILSLISFLKGNIKNVFKHTVKYFVICGLFWISNQVFFWLALDQSSDNKERVVLGLINYLWPALIIIFSLFILSKKANKLLWIGLTLAITGIVVSKLSITDNFEMILTTDAFSAYVLMLIVAVSFAIYSNFSTKLANPDGSSPIFIFMLATSIFLYFIFNVQLPSESISTNSYLILVIWSLFTSLAYFGWDVSMRKGNQTLVASAALLIPFISTLITAWLNYIDINIFLILSGILVSTGAWLSKRGVYQD